MRCSVEKSSAHSDEYSVVSRFPRNCRRLVQSLPGNRHCVDCDAANPEWASVTYGCLLCLKCSGRHRSYGVAISTVRSIHMDHWTYSQILCMLEGGNTQLKAFYHRHHMSSIVEKRYLTKASSFYRSHLQAHARELAKSGPYPGRDVVRHQRQKTSAKRSSKSADASPKPSCGQEQSPQESTSGSPAAVVSAL